MKTDFKAMTDEIKSELQRLTDLKFLKTELNRIGTEISKFNLNLKLPPAAKSRLRQLERQLRDLRKRMTSLQKQVDREVNKFVKVLRKTRTQTEARLKKVGISRGTRRKATRKRASPRS